MNESLGRAGLATRFSAVHDLVWFVGAESSSTAVSSFGGFHLERAHRSADCAVLCWVMSDQICPVCAVVGWVWLHDKHLCPSHLPLWKKGQITGLGTLPGWGTGAEQLSLPTLAVRGSLTNRLALRELEVPCGQQVI